MFRDSKEPPFNSLPEFLKFICLGKEVLAVSIKCGLASANPLRK